MFLNANADNWFWLVIAILVVWRLTTLICYEAGPFNIMTKFRLLLYRIKLGSLIECFHCAAMWASLFVTIALYKTNITLPFMVLAVAGGTSIIERIISLTTNLNEEKNNEND